MALTTVNFDTTFQLDQGPKTFKFTDTTDYAGQGVSLSDVTGVLSITSPTGLHYQNTNFGVPDIDPDVSLDNAITILLPTMGSGEVEQGQYSITYTVQDTSGAPFTVAEVSTFTYSYNSPVVDVNMTVDCVKPELKSVDNTPYTINGVQPAIVRDHRIQYPPSANTADVVGTAPELTTNALFTLKDEELQHSAIVTSDLTYVFPSYMVTDQITGTDYIGVLCDGELCGVYCCIRGQWQRWQDNVLTNQILAEKEKAKWGTMVAYSQLMETALSCGKGEDITAYQTAILDLGNCTGDCGCDDGEPQLVQGVGGGATATTVVVDAGTGIDVTVNVGGGTTTYTVALDADTIASLVALYNTEVVATDSSVVVSDNGFVGGLRRYGVSTPVTEPQSINLDVEIEFTPGSLPTINIISSTVKGLSAKLQSPTIVSSASSGVEFAAFNNVFTVSGFFTGVATSYYPRVSIIEHFWRNGVTESNKDITGTDSIMSVSSIAANDFKFRFEGKVSPGVPTGGSLNLAFSKIKFRLTIIAD